MDGGPRVTPRMGKLALLGAAVATGWAAWAATASGGGLGAVLVQPPTTVASTPRPTSVLLADTTDVRDRVTPRVSRERVRTRPAPHRHR